MKMSNEVKNWTDLSKEEQMQFNLKLGEAVMNDYKSTAENYRLNKKPCTESHNEREWECGWMKDGTEFHIKKPNW